MEEEKQDTNPLEHAKETNVPSSPAENSTEQQENTNENFAVNIEETESTTTPPKQEEVIIENTNDNSAVNIEEIEGTENTPKKEEVIFTYEPDFFDKLKSKTLFVFFGIISVLIAYVFYDFIVQEKVFLFTDIGSDSINIYFPWLAGTSDYLKTETSLAWSFAQGLGQNLFPLSLGDFFSNFLTHFDKSSIPYGIVYMEIIKLLLASLFFYLFLKEHLVSNFVALVFSLLYAFSGFFIVGVCWTIFSVEALYAAIILYGFERWIQHKKFFWVVAGVTLMAYLQPFFLFMYSIFILFYATVRYFELNDKDLKKFSVFLLKTSFLGALALAISAYQLLPDLLQYTESPRVGGDASLFARLLHHPVLKPADSELLATTIYRWFSADMIGTGINFKGSMNYLEAPLFYSGLLCLLLLPQFIISLTKKQKYLYGTFGILFLLPAFFSFFRYAFWAFTGDYYRTYSLIIVIIVVLFTAKAAHHIFKTGQLHKKALVITLLVLIALLFMPFGNVGSYIDSSLRLWATLFLIAYAALLNEYTKSSNTANQYKWILLAGVIFELGFFSNISINQRDVVTDTMLKEKKGYNDYTVEAVAHLKKIDNEFYRINKNYTSGLAIHQSLNDAKVQGYYGTASYFSFNQKNYVKFLNDLNVIDAKDESSTRWIEGLGKRPLLFSLVAGKYYFAKPKREIIGKSFYDSIAHFGNVTVYKNKLALPFGFTYNKIILENDFKKWNKVTKDQIILQACVIENKDKEIVKQFETLQIQPHNDSVVSVPNLASKVNKFTLIDFIENKITGKLANEQDAILFFSMPFDEGWKATLNGQDVKLYRLNCGLTGMLTKKGNNTIELKFTPRLKHTGALISIFSILLLVLILFLDFKSRKSN